MPAHTKFILPKLILPVAAVLLFSTGFAYAETAVPAGVESAAAAEKPLVTRRPMLKDMDRNQDGFVDLTEVEAFTTEQFDLIDNNKDGIITAEEMDTYHHSRRGVWEKQRDPSKADVPGMTPEAAAHLKAKAHERRKDHFASVDPDGDGKITKEEFLNSARERHTKMDLDGDSKVTKEEIRMLHEERNEKFKEHREKMEQRKLEGKTSKPPVRDTVKDDAKATTAE